MKIRPGRRAWRKLGLALPALALWIHPVEAAPVTLKNSILLPSEVRVGATPIGLAFDGSHFFVSAPGKCCIFEVDSNGVLTSTFPVSRKAGALAFAGSTLFAGDFDGILPGELFEFNGSFQIQSTISLPSPPAIPAFLAAVDGLDFDGAHLILSPDAGQHVFTMTTAGTVLSSFVAPDGAGISGVASDGINMFLNVVKMPGEAFSQREILVVDAQGSLRTSFDPRPLVGSGVFFEDLDLRGTSLYAIGGGRIYEFDVGPILIPEPATLVLAVAHPLLAALLFRWKKGRKTVEGIRS